MSYEIYDGPQGKQPAKKPRLYRYLGERFLVSDNLRPANLTDAQEASLLSLFRALPAKQKAGAA